MQKVPDISGQYAANAMKELNVSFSVDRLFPLIYDELRCIARKWYTQRASKGTLSPTAIVHEVSWEPRIKCHISIN